MSQKKTETPAGKRFAFLRQHSRIFWPLLSVVPALVVMRGMFSTAAVYCFRDMSQHFWPQAFWFRHAILAGEFPLWDPYVAFGQSAIADPVRALCFPPVLLLRLVLPSILALNVAVGLAFLVAAIGTYLLLRRTLSPPSAALGAAAFSVMGPFVSTGNMLNFAWSAALLPWVLWAALRLGERYTGARLAVVASLVALQALAGEIVTIAATIGAAVLVAATLEAPGEAGGAGARESVVRAIRVVGAVVAGFALAAIQYIPLFEAVQHSDRGTRAANLSYWATHPLRLVETLAAAPFGEPFVPIGEPWVVAVGSGREPFLLSLYLGVGLVVLAALGVAGIAGQRRRRVVVWGALGFVALLCALGANTPVYPALAAILPPLRLFRYPEKYFVVVAFCSAVLAAEGFESVAEAGRKSLAVAIGAAVAIVVGLLSIAALAPALADAVGVGGDAAGELQETMVWAGLYAAMLGGGIAVAVAATRREGLRRVALAVIFALAIGDLVYASFSLNPQVKTDLVSEPRWVGSVAARGVRFYAGGRAGCPPKKGELDPDTIAPRRAFPASIPITSVQALVAARTAQFPSLWSAREAVSVDSQQLFAREYKDALQMFCNASAAERARFLERTGVRAHLLTHPPVASFETQEPIEGLQPIAAYASAAPFNRCAVVPSARVVPDTGDAIRALFDESFDPAGEVLVDRDATRSGASGTAAPPDATRQAGARIVRDRANSVEIEATVPGESTLVLYDTYFPGWTVDVDGAPAEMLRADGLFRGVRLAPGTHTVRFSFMPRSFVLGAVVSIVVALALIVLSLYRRRSA
jgi:hypothetical protein